jgi:hypothetical protein
MSLRQYIFSLDKIATCTELMSSLAFTEVAHAQSSAAPVDQGLREIVVPGPRRDQRLQVVPVATTALAGQTPQSNRPCRSISLADLRPT